MTDLLLGTIAVVFAVVGYALLAGLGIFLAVRTICALIGVPL